MYNSMNGGPANHWGECLKVINAFGLFVSFGYNSGFKLFDLSSWIAFRLEYPHGIDGNLSGRDLVYNLLSVVFENRLYFFLYRVSPVRVLDGIIKVSWFNSEVRIWIENRSIENKMVTESAIWFLVFERVTFRDD